MNHSVSEFQHSAALQVIEAESAEARVAHSQAAIPTPVPPARQMIVYPAPMLELQLLKCRTLRACCTGSEQCPSTSVAPIAARQLGRFPNSREIVASYGLDAFASVIAEADTSQPPSCQELRQGGATTCPVDGCPLPNGNIATTPEELLQWDCDFRDVGDVILARSVVASEFGSGLLVTPDDKMYAPKNGAYQQIDDRSIKNMIVKHLGTACSVSNADSIRKMILITEFQDADVQPSRNHICFANGTLDVISGEMCSHSIEYNLFNRIPHDYAAGSACPTFLRFLESVWQGDTDAPQKRRFIQQWMGYLLVANSSLQRMLILKGEGANGKSVLMDVARNLVGEDNTKSSMLGRLHMPYVRSTLDKMLLNQSADLPKLGRIADGDLKAIISGDSIEVAPKYKPSFTIKPYVRMMVATNNLPQSSDTTDGYFRRLVILSFNRRIPDSERDPQLLSRLLGEMPGIVAWAVSGLRDLYTAGDFIIPPSSEQEVHAYREELSPATTFAEECLEPSTDRSGMSAKEVFVAFDRWCKPHGFAAGNAITLGRELTRLGFRSRKSGTTVWMLRASEGGKEYFPPGRTVNSLGHAEPTRLI